MPGQNLAEAFEGNKLNHKTLADLLHLAYWLLASAVSSLFLGLVYLFIFRHAPKTMVSFLTFACLRQRNLSAVFTALILNCQAQHMAIHG